MQNEMFDRLVAALSSELGAPKEHESGTGVRFTSARRGKATVYHSGVAPGNQAEIAFEVDSMSQRLGLSASEFRARLADLRKTTGRDVQPNAQYNWPRVGLVSVEQIELVMQQVRG